MGIRPVLAMMAVVAALGIMAADTAEARRGMSVGSRGARTFTAPPTTPTAPTPAAPIQRSMTPQTAPAAAAARPPMSRPSMFGSGLAGGLMRGLLIGGLIGLLMGGGIGGFAGFLGLLLQGALLALVVMLVLRFLRRPQPVPAGAHGRMAAGPGGWPGSPVPGQEPAASTAPPMPPPPRERSDDIGIAAADYDAFERLLVEIETAFDREDEAALRMRATGEVFDYMVTELRANADRGVRNEVRDVKLLQGDLAEAWREGGMEYATVAMLYQSLDRIVDRATGRILSGDRERPGEGREVWTFVRKTGSGAAGWRLSAMQTV